MSVIPFNGVLRECQLEGIPFPVENVMMHFSQDIAIHKYPNVPGANVESLSRNPVTFSVRALFINGLRRDKTETWTNLFPMTFQNVMRVLNDGNNPTIKFQHPTLGKFNVKVVHGSTETTYMCRNGQIIEFDLIEDGNNDATVQQNILGVDETANGTQAAQGLDQRLVAYAAANPNIPASALPNTSGTYFTNLYSTAIAPTASTSTSVGTSSAVAGYAIDQVTTSRDQLFSLNDPSNAFMLIEMEQINSALNDQRCNNQSLNVYTTKTAVTLNQVLITLQNYNNKLTIEALLQLNPQLSLTSPNINPGTLVYWS